VVRPARSPLEGVDRVLVDGSNLLYAIRRGPTPLPPAARVGRLRAAVPPEVSIELVFDGRPEPGLRGERIAAGLLVRHSGSRTGDELIVQLVEEARGAVGPRGADNVLVVTDDAELRAAVSALGARTAKSPWLVARLARERLEAPTTGNRRPPRVGGSGSGSASADRDSDETDRPRWRPGRGATTKRGNPRRGRRSPS
jgi:rRNA-processing protein FCF1